MSNFDDPRPLKTLKDKCMTGKPVKKITKKIQQPIV